jgi:hypothetical protein
LHPTAEFEANCIRMGADDLEFILELKATFVDLIRKVRGEKLVGGVVTTKTSF